jgi:hypothetical protein
MGRARSLPAKEPAGTVQFETMEEIMQKTLERFLIRSAAGALLAVLGVSAFADSPQLSMGGYARGLQRLETMAMMDVDRDHKVTREEFMKFHETLFDRMDGNHDGVIDQGEWQRRLGGIGGKGTN